MAAASQAALLLAKQFQDLKRNPIEGFSAGLIDESDPFSWQLVIVGPDNTPYEGGIFKATLSFPKDYPNNPPLMKFVSEFWHPNVFKNGVVCISILHPPGDDTYGYESAAERWNPVHTVSTILLSVISMLSDPNLESAANVDAAREFRDDKKTYSAKIRMCVRKSLEEQEED